MAGASPLSLGSDDDDLDCPSLIHLCGLSSRIWVFLWLLLRFRCRCTPARHDLIYSQLETFSAQGHHRPALSATNFSQIPQAYPNRTFVVAVLAAEPDMSTMTEIYAESKPAAALLFDSDAVNAEPLDLGTVNDEEMLDLSGLRTVKEGSLETGMSRSASVEARLEKGSSRSTPSATPSLHAKPKSKLGKPPVQLIGHLPRAEEEALTTFTEIPDNHYQYGTLGKSREALESMTCDCQYEHGQFAFPHGSSSFLRFPLIQLLHSYACSWSAASNES